MRILINTNLVYLHVLSARTSGYYSTSRKCGLLQLMNRKPQLLWICGLVNLLSQKMVGKYVKETAILGHCVPSVGHVLSQCLEIHSQDHSTNFTSYLFHSQFLHP